MFGKKQEYTKDLEERLNTFRSQIDMLQGKIKQAENSSRQMPQFFESQIIAQSDMDKELTKVESKAHEAMDASSESGQAYEQFAIEFTSMRGQLEEEEKKKKLLQELICRQKKQLAAAPKENEKQAAPKEQLREENKQLADDLQEVHSQLKEMQDFSKQMSVLSMNCAIEAGRLGENGRQFISAAEDIRQLSNAYECAAEAISQKLEAFSGHLKQIETQADSLIEMIKSNDKLISHLAKTNAEAEGLCGEMADQAYSEKALALTAILKKISQSHETVASLQRQSLSGIQLIGASLKDEQEARKEMERVIEQMEQKLKGGD